ncbi:hypothetical protein [Pseudomonas sp. MYb185]|uniref:hypothetical protein n=1 Tax=Pseudomonas sp. MYb185 TaxID=1848729 RepID=UPI000CFC3274|nr:hypothetical protein [Pseudomonas sp. MYb185]PRB76517.1 hypothetical protein CQ007_17355 [Pseudomonas sp. MYb185]
MRQPDIEIYLKEDFLDELNGWLEQHVGRVDLGPWSGTTRRGTLHGDAAIPLMIVRKAAGKWASIWFESEATPWATDLDCARAVAAGINREVRCSIGGWEEAQGEADADRWYKVTTEGEEEFTWALKP